MKIMALQGELCRAGGVEEEGMRNERVCGEHAWHRPNKRKKNTDTRTYHMNEYVNCKRKGKRQEP